MQVIITDSTIPIRRRTPRGVRRRDGRCNLLSTVKDIYMEMDRPGEGHDQMVQVILENARGISPRAPRPAGKVRERRGGERPPRELPTPQRR